MPNHEEIRRLPWRHGVNGGFIAHPDGVERHTAFVYEDITVSPDFRWRWSVDWPNRFSRRGGCATKQEAADQATYWWWWCVENEPPEKQPERSDHEVIEEMLEAALTRPVDFDLQSRSTEWLQRLNAQIMRRWWEEIRREQTPPAISQVMRESSEILYRRRSSAR